MEYNVNIDRILISQNPPESKNLAWYNPTKRELRVFVNGEWAIAAGDEVSQEEFDTYVRLTDEHLAALDEGKVDGPVAQSTGSSTSAVMSQKAITDELGLKANKSEMTVTNGTGADADKVVIQLKSGMTATVLKTHQDITGKADKVSGATNGNFAALDNNGNLKDSNVSPNDVARVDGYYETMSVGSADNLNGQNADTDTWEERPVGGEGAEVATGLASVQAIGGNGYAWNQLVENPNFSDSTKWEIVDSSIGSLTINNNTATVERLTNGTINLRSSRGIDIPSGHKFYISRYVWANNAGYIAGGIVNVIDYSFAISANTWTRTAVVNVASNNYTNRRFNITTSTNEITELKVKNFICIDLTLLGIDNLTTAAEVEAWLATHIGTKPYYPYNTGTLLPAKLQAYKTTGRSANLLNPTTRTARLFAYTWPDHNNMFTIKELPSGLTLTFTPDATGVAETITPDGNGHFSVSGSGNIVVSGSANLSATWLIATWDESMDDYDNFEAWDGKEYAFDTSKVYGKLNGAGDYVQVFPNGMRGAGSARDMLNLANAEAVVKIMKRQFTSGDTWSYNSEYNLFRFNVGSDKSGIRYSSNILLDLGKYTKSIVYYSDSPTGDMRYGFIADTNWQFSIIDSHYDSASSFAEAMNGAELWYELTTPLVYTDCVYRDNGVDTPLSELNILVNNWAYEQAVVAQQADAFSTEKAYAIGDYVTYSDVQYRFTAAKTAGAWDSTKVTADASPVSCAAQSSILYGIDAVEQLDTLKETGIDIDAMRSNLDAMLTAMQTAGIIGGYTLSDTPTNKVFSISITAPSEPEV